MPIALQQSKSVDGGSATSANLTFTSSVLASSLIVVDTRISANGRTITVSDDKGGSYASAFAAINDTNGDDMESFYAMGAAGGSTTVTVAISGAATTIRFAITEYSGVATSNAFDKVATATGSSTTPNSGATATTTQSDEVLHGYLDNADSTGAASFTQGSGYTKQEQLVVTGHLKIGTEYKVVAATGAYSADTTLNISDKWVMAILTFKGAPVGNPLYPSIPFMSPGRI